MANLINLPCWNVRWNIYIAPVLTICPYTYCGGCSVLSLWNLATRRLYKISRGCSMAVICSLYFDLPFGLPFINNTMCFVIWKASRKIPINPSFTISTWNVCLNWSVVLFWADVTEVYHLNSQWSSMVVGWLLLFGPIIWVPADTSLNLGNISKDLYYSCVDHLSSHLLLELVGCFIVDLYVTERGNMEERGICRQDKIASRGLSDYLGT